MLWHRRILRPSLAVVVIALGATASWAFDQDLYSRATDAFAAGNWDEAASGFATLVGSNPDWAPGHVILGQTYLLLGRIDEGQRQLNEAKKIDPGTDLFRAYASVGQELVKRARYSDAADAFQWALDRAPKNMKASVSKQLAGALMGAQRYPEARKALREALAAGGPDPRTEFDLALACRRLDDYECAVQQLQKVRESGKDPSQGKLPEYLARWSYDRALLPQNQSRRPALLAETLDAARQWYRESPDNPGARRYLGETLLALRRDSEVIRTFRPIADRDSADCTAALMVARAENAQGNGKEAEPYARRAIECDAKNGDAHVELAAALVRQVSPEQTSLEQVRSDLGLAQDALTQADRAQQLRPDARTKALRAETAATVARLQAAETDFVASEQDYAKAVTDAKEKETTDRCLAIYWERRDPARQPSPESDRFWQQNDCKSRVHERGVTPP